VILLVCFCGCAIKRTGERPQVFGQEAWEREVRRHGIDPAAIRYPLAWDADMESAARGAAGPGIETEQLESLQRYLFDDSLFDYEADITYTAKEAFDNRTGNCVAFTSLFIALARSQHIPVRAALLTYPDSAEQDGDLVVVRNHIVAIHGRADKMRIFDLYRLGNRPHPSAYFLDDIGITAVYLNNIGSEALLAGDEEAALRDFEIAAALAPEFVSTYANLGVVRRRLGDIDGALEAYHQGLRIELNQPTVLNNLAALYHSQGMVEEAEAAVMAADTRGAPPNLLIVRGNIELTEENYRKALKYFKHAMKLSPEAPEPRVAIARVRIAQGKRAAALRALRRALKLDPDHAPARELAGTLENASEPSPGPR
jgi:tetratricopeptide (TPR) repeat protein